MRVVLVTGAGGALGSELARQFHQRGDVVVTTDLVEPGGGSHSMACDLTDPTSLEDLVEGVRQRLGRLDVLVNCAGLTHRSPSISTDPAVFASVMAVNWEAPVRLTQLAFPLLEESGGTVVNLGSMAGWMPVLGRSAYGASKAALTQWMEVFRHEAAPRGVHVLNVYPSFLDAVMSDSSGDSGRSRSTTGRLTPVPDMARLIIEAEERRLRWLFPDRLSRLSSLLWRVWPTLYGRLMVRRFRSELG